jgi:hypothetical protein
MELPSFSQALDSADRLSAAVKAVRVLAHLSLSTSEVVKGSHRRRRSGGNCPES